MMALMHMSLKLDEEVSKSFTVFSFFLLRSLYFKPILGETSVGQELLDN